MGEVEAEVVKQPKLETDEKGLKKVCGLVKEALVLVAMLLLHCMHAS